MKHLEDDTDTNAKFIKMLINFYQHVYSLTYLKDCQCFTCPTVSPTEATD